ncbi:hypothetical protein ACFO0M_24875 [Micromonospora mangrovi]|uniref:Uncharacterized protein n=2 Tax=Micromonospora TaxID=1873 RepID=A0AAU7MEV8_9ACTN
MSGSPDRGRLLRRVALILAAVGAGFLAAALFGGPAAASDPAGGSSGDAREPLVSPLIGATVRVALGGTSTTPASRSTPTPTVGADDRPVRRPAVPIGTTVGGIHRARSTTAPGRPEVAAGPATRTPVVAGVVGRPAVRPGPARADRRAVPGADVGSRAVDRRRQPVSAGVAAPGSILTPAGPSVVGLVVAPLRQVLRVVCAGPVGAVVTAFTRVTDAVLAPVLGAVTAPILGPPAPSSPSPPPSGAGVAPVSGPPAVPLPAAPRSAGTPQPHAIPVVPGVVPAPASASGFGPTRSAGSVGPVGSGGARVRLALASSPRPAGPLPLTDQAAAAAPHGPQPGSGLSAAAGWLTRCAAGRAREAGTLVVPGRSPSVVARPG